MILVREVEPYVIKEIIKKFEDNNNLKLGELKNILINKYKEENPNLKEDTVIKKVNSSINFLKRINFIKEDKDYITLNNKILEKYKEKTNLEEVLEEYLKNEVFKDLIEYFNEFNIKFLKGTDYEIFKNYFIKNNIKETKEATVERNFYYFKRLLNELIYYKNFSFNDLNIEIDNLDTKEELNKLREIIKDLILAKISDEENYEKYIAYLDLIIQPNMLKDIINTYFNGNVNDFVAALFKNPDYTTPPNYNYFRKKFNKAYELLDKYLVDKKDIIVFTDIDNDGTNAFASVKILKDELKLKNLDVDYCKSYPTSIAQHGITYEAVKEKLIEKYGSLENAKNQDILIITADNGSGKENLEEIKRIIKDFPNLKIIVTDHHYPKYKQEEIEKLENVAVVNWHFLTNEEIKLHLRNYELSGAQTFIELMKNSINKNFYNLFKEDKEIDEFYLQQVFNDLNLLIIISQIQDIVPGFEQYFISNELLNEISSISNKLNALYTAEILVNKAKEKNFVDEFAKTFGVSEETAVKFKNYLLNIEKVAGILLNIVNNIDKYNNQNINELLKDFFKNINNTEIETFFNKYSNLFYLRPVIARSLIKSGPVTEIGEQIHILLKESNILNDIKSFEKEFKKLLENTNPDYIRKYNSKYANIITINNNFLSRKLALKLFSNSLNINNGILILIDKINKEKGTLVGSIRQLDYRFSDIFNMDKEVDNNVINEVNKELRELGIKINIKGHEAKAAGIEIKGLNRAVEKIKNKYNTKNDDETYDKVLKLITEKISRIYEEREKEKEKYTLNKDINIKIRYSDMGIFLNLLNHLGLTRNSAKSNQIKLIVDTKELILFDGQNHVNIEQIKKKLDDLPSYLTSTLLYVKENGKTEKLNLVISKSLLMNNSRYIEFKPLSSNALIATRNLKKLPENTLKPDSKLLGLNEKQIESYGELFNKKNNYTIKIKLDELKEKFPLLNISNNLKNLIDKYINNIFNQDYTKLDNLVFADIEGTGFGLSSLINIGLVSFEKEGNEIYAKITSIFVKPKNKEKISSAIQNLTGISNEFLEKYGIEQEEADKLLYELYKNKKFMIEFHNSLYDTTIIEANLPQFFSLMNKNLILDTKTAARKEKLGTPYSSLYKYEIEVKNINTNNKKRMSLGIYTGNTRNIISFPEFLSGDKTTFITMYKGEKLLYNKFNNYLEYTKDGLKHRIDLNNSKISLFREVTKEDDIYKTFEKTIIDENGKLDNYIDIIATKEHKTGMVFSVQSMLNKLQNLYITERINNNSDFKILESDFYTNIKYFDEIINKILKYNNFNTDISDKYEFILENKNLINEYIYPMIENDIKNLSSIFLNDELSNKFKSYIEKQLNDKKITKKNVTEFVKENYKNIISFIKLQILNKYIEKENIKNYSKNFAANILNDVMEDENILKALINYYVGKTTGTKIQIDKIQKTINNKTFEKIVDNLLNKYYEILDNKNNIDLEVVSTVMKYYNPYVKNKDFIIKNLVETENNLIPQTFISKILKTADNFFEELKIKKPEIFNKFKHLKEIFKEPHLNVNLISDNLLESTVTVILLNKLKNLTPEQISIYLLNQAVIRDLRDYIKFNLINEKGINEFSAFQAIDKIQYMEADDLQDTVDKNLLKKYKHIYNKRLEKGHVLFKISDTNNKYNVKFYPNDKIKDKFKFNNVLNNKHLINYLSEMFNTLYKARKIERTLLTAGGFDKELLHEILAMLENVIINLENEISRFGRYEIVLNKEQYYLKKILNKFKEKIINVALNDVHLRIKDINNINKNEIKRILLSRLEYLLVKNSHLYVQFEDNPTEKNLLLYKKLANIMYEFKDKYKNYNEVISDMFKYIGDFINEYIIPYVVEGKRFGEDVSYKFKISKTKDIDIKEKYNSFKELSDITRLKDKRLISEIISLISAYNNLKNNIVVEEEIHKNIDNKIKARFGSNFKVK